MRRAVPASAVSRGEMTVIATRRPSLSVAALVACICLSASGTAAQTLEAGTVIERVTCGDEPSQTYALYLPSAYSPDRKWSLLLAFHPAARGRPMVEKYRAAAEVYGFIVAASNNSRNGPYNVSIAAAQAMTADVSRRLSIDSQRVYLTGMSGGARVATGIALGTNNIAGVIASSAGYPDNRPRAKVPFAMFGTAGTEDFNYIEMRLLDRTLSSPHFLVVFDGGHSLPPDDVAFDALEWMELQAMQSGRRSRDDALVGRLLEKRRARIASSGGPTETIYLLRAFVSDFRGLADVSAEASRLEEMSRQSDIKKALKRERDADDAAARMLREILTLEAQLSDQDQHDAALMTLRNRLLTLSGKSAGEVESPERSQARRVLRAIASGASERVQDREYLTLLERYRQSGR